MANRQITRRHFFKTAGIFTAGIITTPHWALAQDSPVTTIINAAAASPVTVKSLRGNISILQGSGGNIGVLSAKDGKLLVDAGIDVSRKKIKDALASINDQPVKHLINTHWHFDHASGNEWLHQEGAVITAHQNTKKNLSRTIRVDDWNYTFPPAPAGALPTRTFTKKHHLRLLGESIELDYYGPAHTDSDISLYFEKADILHVADTWWNGYYPFIDYNTNGSIKGMIAAASKNIGMITDKTIVIPGHGEPGRKEELKVYHDMLVTIFDKISNLKKQGLSLQEVVQAKPTEPFDEKWGQFVINGNFFTSLVYRGA